MEGKNVFFMVAREMNLVRNYTTTFSCTDGGDLAKEFEMKGAPLMKRALKAKLNILREKIKTVNGKRKVRPSTKSPRNMAEEIIRPDFKEC